MKTSSGLASILVFALFVILPSSLPSRAIGADVESEVANHMHEYLTRITTIKSFIIMGNLDRVRDSATWLVEHETVPGLPENFELYVEMMRSHAREVVGAPTRCRRIGLTLLRTCNAINGRPIVCGRV